MDDDLAGQEHERRRRRRRVRKKGKSKRRSKFAANLLQDLRWLVVAVAVGVPLLAALFYLVERL